MSIEEYNIKINGTDAGVFKTEKAKELVAFFAYLAGLKDYLVGEYIEDKDASFYGSLDTKTEYNKIITLISDLDKTRQKMNKSSKKKYSFTFADGTLSSSEDGEQNISLEEDGIALAEPKKKKKKKRSIVA